MIIKKNNNEEFMSMFSEFSIGELEGIVYDNPSLRGYLQGYLAEASLKKQLLLTPGITSVVKIPDQDPEKGDFKVIYNGKPMTIEVKSIGTNTVKEDVLTDTWQGTVSVKNTDKREVFVDGIGTFSSTSLERGQFDILAISCYAVSGKWDFLFIENDYLPEKASNMKNLLKTSFVVNPRTTPCVTSNVLEVLNSTWDKKL